MWFGPAGRRGGLRYDTCVRVRSLGLYTDLALASWRGVVHDRHDHLVVSHPQAPAFKGGNMLVFERPPEADDAARWCALYDRAFPSSPERDYRSLSWDGVDGEDGYLGPFLANGFERDDSVVLLSERLEPPTTPALDVRIAPLRSDAEWEAAVAVQAADAEPSRRQRYQRLVSAVMRLNRRATDAGHGVWWGAFRDDEMIATLGLFRVDELARFQAVVTHPRERGRGVASTLLHHAAEAARSAWGTRTLVLEAAADARALAFYQRLGLSPSERRTSLTQSQRLDAATT